MHYRKMLSWFCLFSLFWLTMFGFIFVPGDTVLASGSGTITVVSPGSGQVWTTGSQQTISWNYSGVSDSQVTITLFKAGKSKMHIASKTAIGSNGSGTYTWGIPSTLAEGSDYQIKVLSSHCPDGDYSEYFTIGAGDGSTTNTNDASLNLVSPSTGDVWPQGSDQTIQWNYTGDPGSQVTITLFKAGTSKMHIASKTNTGANGSGSYTWTIPASMAEGSDYQVKVVSPKFSDGAWSGYFTIGAGNGSEDDNPQQTQTGKVLINDASFVTLTALNTNGQYKLQIKANSSSTPVEVSYLVLNPETSPSNPSTGIVTKELIESENSWGGAKQYFGHTEVGGWALPQYKQNPKVFALPHYRTCVMMLARYENVYMVFLRENDGQLTYKVFKGGAFNGLNVPGLGQVVRSGEQFQIHSEGTPVEVGIWDKGAYKHDEVTGWAQASYQANDKLYAIPKYGMFMLTIGRYDKLGVIIGNYNDGKLGTVCFSGSKLLGTESVSGLCEITNAGSPHIRVRATGNDPVEISQFAFDNTCWQWEVNGWGKQDFQQNPQVLPLKHYIPGFITCSRYDKAGIFFYNENDSQMGILPITSSTQVVGSSVSQPNTSSSNQSGGIVVLLNGKALSFDQPPVIIEGRTLVPMAAIFKALGAEISWNGSTQTVTASRGDTTVILVIGMESALVNGHETPLSPPAQIINGRTMVPLAFVAQALGAAINWDGATETITITQSNTNQSAGNDTTQLTGKQVIEKFFNLVDSGDINSALTLLDTGTLGDASSQEMWQNSLGSINSAAIISLEAYNKTGWTSTTEQYKVIVSIKVNDGGQTLWSNGEETRWFSLIKTNGQWKIQAIATGP